MFELKDYVNYMDEKVVRYLINPLEDCEGVILEKISVCIMTYNEERCLKRCIESIWDIADEIIIIDTGSTDNTNNILKEFNDKIKLEEYEYYGTLV